MTPSAVVAAAACCAIALGWLLGVAAPWLRTRVRRRGDRRTSLTIVTRGPGSVGGGRADSAFTSLTYRPREPYGVEVCVVIGDRAGRVSIGRDLFADALRDGAAGIGNARVVRTSRRVRVSVGDPRGVVEASFRPRVVRRAVRQWYAAVPAGTEAVPDLDAALEDWLRPRSTP